MELELKELFGILRKRMWIIISVILAACFAVGIISNYFTEPVYYASAKLIVNKSGDSSNTGKLDPGTLNANIQLIVTYKEILKTPAILDKVAAEHPEFQLSSNGINARVTVSSKELSQVMTIGVQDSSQVRAANIVNAVADVFKREIPQIMKVDNVTILSEANPEPHPVPISPNSRLNIVIAFIASLIASVGIALLWERLDDTIKSEQDIEQVLGLPALATIARSTKEDLTKHTQPAFQRSVGEKNYAGSN